MFATSQGRCPASQGDCMIVQIKRCGGHMDLFTEADWVAGLGFSMSNVSFFENLPDCDESTSIQGDFGSGLDRKSGRYPRQERHFSEDLV